MAEITLTKDDTGRLVGLSEADKAALSSFKRRTTEMEPGEICSIETWNPRKGSYHRRHMKIEATVFQSQERIANFDMFRDWLKVGAGFVVWMAGPKGGVIPIPKSISYKKADEDVMREFHKNAIAFLRSEHATRYMWPHLDAQQGADMINTILRGFGE